MDPLSAFPSYDTLSTKNHTVLNIVIQSTKSCLDISLCEYTGCLIADAVKYFISVVVSFAVIVSAATGTLAIVIVVMMVLVLMLMFVLVAMTLLTVLVVVMVLVLIVIVVVATAALAVLMVVMLMLIVIMVVAATALTIVIVVVMMLVLVCLEKCSSHSLSCNRVLDSGEDLLTRKLLPRCCDDL